MRMNAADTSDSIATADWTPLTVVSRSRTTAEIETFMNDVSITNTNIAEARKMPSRGSALACSSELTLETLLSYDRAQDQCAGSNPPPSRTRAAPYRRRITPCETERRPRDSKWIQQLSPAAADRGDGARTCDLRFRDHCRVHVHSPSGRPQQRLRSEPGWSGVRRRGRPSAPGGAALRLGGGLAGLQLRDRQPLGRALPQGDLLAVVAYRQRGPVQQRVARALLVDLHCEAALPVREPERQPGQRGRQPRGERERTVVVAHPAEPRDSHGPGACERRDVQAVA